MRKETSAQEKEEDPHWESFSGDERMVAIRTFLHVRICINSGLSIPKKNIELQHGDCTTLFTEPAGRTKKPRTRSSKTKTVTELSPRKESATKKESL